MPKSRFTRETKIIFVDSGYTLCDMKKIISRDCEMSLTKSHVMPKETFVDTVDLPVNASCIPTNYITL